MQGQRVIVVDMDPQAHLTIHLGQNPKESGPGVYEVLTKSSNLAESLVEVRERLWLLGSNIDLVGAESELVSVVGREIILREALETLEDGYDYIMIDCPPSLGLLTLNALTAAKEAFIPVQPHFLALQGFGTLLETITLVTRRINPALKVTGVLLCMYDKRALLPAEVKADIEQFLDKARERDYPWSGAQIIPVHVRRNIKLAEAPSYGKTIFEYEPKCNGAADYKTVAEYIHSQTGADKGQAGPVVIGEDKDRSQADISKKPPIPIHEIPLEKKVATMGDEALETSQTDTNLSTTGG